jgi:cellulose biosynthesis protein BcsQ
MTDIGVPINEKGGVGKTTISEHMAMWTAAQGDDALAIDADPQGHLTKALQLKKQPGIYNLLVRDGEPEGKWSNVLKLANPEMYGGGGKLYAVPSNIETRGIPLMINDVWKLDTRLRQLARQINLKRVVIDTPPTPTLLHSAILEAADWVIYLTECEYNSLDSLVETMAHIKEANQRRAGSGRNPIRELGIVPMMYRGGTRNHADNLEAMQDYFKGMVWQPINLSTDWPSASGVQKPVWEYAPNSTATKDWYAFIERFEAEMGAARS